MSMHLNRIVSQNEQWIDTLKRDNVFCGIGTANNQLHKRDGRKSEMHPPEDRSFAVVLKDDSIYAYGLLDGYNGAYAAQFIELHLLLNIFIDDLNDNLESKPDSEIFAIMQEQIRSSEDALEKELIDKLNDRTSLSISIPDMGQNHPHYNGLVEKLKALDQELGSGVFLALSLIVGKRMFTVNVGTVRCFLYSTNTDGNNSVLPLSLEHTLSNPDEEFRVQRLKGITNAAYLNSDDNFIHYTRTLGDFKTKVYFNEFEQFKNCTKSPILSVAEHYTPATSITDDCLFMVMYSEALAKAIEKTGLDSSNVEEKIAQMLLEKIKTEVSLNSAAQAVVDDIKRSYDDSCRPGQLELREDLTLIVRVFNENLKDALNADENEGFNDSMQNTIDFNYTDSMESAINSANSENSNDTKKDEIFDGNGHAIPYIDFNEYNSMINSDSNIKCIMENFEKELELLTIVDDNSRL